MVNATRLIDGRIVETTRKVGSIPITSNYFSMREVLFNMPHFNVTVYKEAYYYNVKANSAEEAEAMCLRKCFPTYETAKAQKITYKESQKLKRILR